MILGCVQPTYLPWLGFFYRMYVSDIFVILDDVEYSKNNYFNRNKIKTNFGLKFLTLPVKYRGSSKDKINQIEINDQTNWKKKHYETIKQSYSKKSFYKNYDYKIKKMFLGNEKKLIDWQLKFIYFFKESLKIKTETVLASSLNIKSTGNQKLVDICKKLNSSNFLVKPDTTHYHPKDFFKKQGINFCKLIYPSEIYLKENNVIEGISAIDYLMNNGDRLPAFFNNV